MKQKLRRVCVAVSAAKLAHTLFVLQMGGRLAVSTRADLEHIQECQACTATIGRILQRTFQGVHTIDRSGRITLIKARCKKERCSAESV